MSKVLVVEDEASIQKVVKANLTASGYRVFVTDTGEEGLRLARTERLDLILLDLRLPAMSGWDVLMAIRTSPKLRKIPVVIMTATAPETEEYRVRGMRAAEYLTKPFNTDELLDTIRQVLGE